jgi:hypothetical protein
MAELGERYVEVIKFADGSTKVYTWKVIGVGEKNSCCIRLIEIFKTDAQCKPVSYKSYDPAIHDKQPSAYLGTVVSASYVPDDGEYYHSVRYSFMGDPCIATLDCN